MKTTLNRHLLIASLVIGFTGFHQASSARAVGVLYADPGWSYAYDGDEAFYNDPDGYNPDYINGDDTNQPGGKSWEAILVDPANNGGVTEWISASSQWEGSAPGDTLGAIPTGVPPLPPPAPGGVATYTDSGTTYLRIQDPGQPQGYGWTDKGAQAGPGAPLQEGNNRKLQFGHNIANDPSYSGDPAVLDNGITVSFRTRLATRATGPLDDIFPEGGTTLANVVAWPEDGVGQEVANSGRGLFHLTQTAAGQGQQMAFSLLDSNTINFSALQITKTGLVMNNPALPGMDVDTEEANDSNVNIVEIPHEDLDQWAEFWITVQAIQAPVDDNTHEVNVFYNGSLEPETFQIILSNENEFGTDPYLGMGMTSGTRLGAYDVDFFAYQEGVLPPTLAAVENADFDGDTDVDGADFLAWQRGYGITGGASPAQGDADGNGTVDAVDLGIWSSQFGTTTAAELRAVPEPSAGILVLLMTVSLCLSRRVIMAVEERSERSHRLARH